MKRALLALGLVSVLLGCGGPIYKMNAPQAFKRFEKTKDFRYITADGVMLRGREVENYPLADLAFWREALKGHLVQRGYAFKSESCFKTEAKLDGCTLDFLVPYGAEDWIQSVTLYVVGERVILVETAGPYERYTPLEKDLAVALRTFDPGK